MDTQQAIDLGREALWTMLIVGSPVLVAGLVVGLLVGLFQALTQIQEQKRFLRAQDNRHVRCAEHFAAVADLADVAVYDRSDRRHPRPILRVKARLAMSNQWPILFTLVFARMGGMVMTAPVFGAGVLPIHLRAMLALALALLTAPVLGGNSAVQISGPAQYFILLGGEVIVGACLGLGIMILLHGLTMAGSMVAHAAGLSIAENVRSHVRRKYAAVFPPAVSCWPCACFFC